MWMNCMRLDSKFICMCAAVFFASCGSQPDEQADLTKPQPLVSVTPLPPSVSAGMAGKDEHIVAKWDGGQLTLRQIDQFVLSNNNPAGPDIEDATLNKERIKQERRKVTETLVGNYLLILEARENGISLSNAEQEALLHKAKGNFESQDIYKKYLTDADQTEDDFLNILVNIELGKKCVEEKNEEIWNSITQNRMRQFYEDNIDKFTPAHRTFFNRVDIHAKGDRTLEEAKKRAVELRAQVAERISKLDTLDAKRDVMREYAREYSDSFEASYNGGYVTMYHNKDFEEAFSDGCMQTAKSTPVGELSEVYRSQHGYGFLLVKTQHQSFVHPFESETIQKIVPSMILDEEIKKWRDELKEKYNLVIYEEMYEHKFPPHVQTAQAATSP